MAISVVIPVYNEERYIKQCLTSLMNQDTRPDEIIIVDNNCTDKTIEIAKQFPVNIIYEKTQGIIAARNTGFSAAQYDIIARCDADNKHPRNWIQKIQMAFDDNSIDAVTGTFTYYDSIFLNIFVKPLTIFFFTITKYIYGHYLLHGTNMALRKKAWNTIKHRVTLDDAQVHEDFDLAVQIAKQGKTAFNPDLETTISARRLKQNPLSAFGEYPYRWIRSLFRHKLSHYNQK